MSDSLLLNADGTPLSQIPLSIVPWQVAIRLLSLEKVRVLKEYDDWVIHSQRLSMNVPSIVICTTQVKWTKHLKYSRSNVYLRDGYACQLKITSQCKGRDGHWDIADLTLDHVVPKSHGGKTNWANVVTCCKKCNGEKGNDHTIVPKKAPYKPSYYEILAKRKTMPVFIRDEEWKFYIDWPDHLIKLVKHNGNL